MTSLPAKSIATLEDADTRPEVLFLARIGNWPNPESILYAESAERFYRYDYDSDAWTVIGASGHMTLHLAVPRRGAA